MLMASSCHVNYMQNKSIFLLGLKVKTIFGTQTFQIALNMNWDLALFGVELLGVRGG